MKNKNKWVLWIRLDWPAIKERVKVDQPDLTTTGTGSHFWIHFKNKLNLNCILLCKLHTLIRLDLTQFDPIATLRCSFLAKARLLPFTWDVNLLLQIWIISNSSSTFLDFIYDKAFWIRTIMNIRSTVVSWVDLLSGTWCTHSQTPITKENYCQWNLVNLAESPRRK